MEAVCTLIKRKLGKENVICLCVREYGLAIKNDKFGVLRTWIHLENIILSKTNQKHKLVYHMVYLI